MDFQKWHDEQWFPVYHPLVTKVRELVPDMAVVQSRISGLWTEFNAFRKDIYGNGQKGYVERVVRERVDDLKGAMRAMIDDSISEAFAKRDAEQKKADTETRKEWGGRTWGIVVILFNFILALLQAYFIWRMTG
jgi:hypothetical protein